MITQVIVENGTTNGFLPESERKERIVQHSQQNNQSAQLQSQFENKSGLLEYPQVSGKAPEDSTAHRESFFTLVIG